MPAGSFYCFFFLFSLLDARHKKYIIAFLLDALCGFSLEVFSGGIVFALVFSFSLGFLCFFFLFSVFFFLFLGFKSMKTIRKL